MNIEDYQNQRFSYRNAQLLLSGFWQGRYHELCDIVSKLPKVDKCGYFTEHDKHVPKSDLYVKRQSLVRTMLRYKTKLMEYSREAQKVLQTLKDSRNTVSNVALQLLKRHTVHEHTKPGEGIHEMYLQYQELIHKLQDAVNAIDAILVKAAQKKYPSKKAKQPDMFKTEKKRTQEDSKENPNSSLLPIYNPLNQQHLSDADTVDLISVDNYSLGQCIKELRSVYRMLPRVDANGYSECPSARELYIRKAELENKLKLYLYQLQQNVLKLKGKKDEYTRRAIVIDDDANCLSHSTTEQKYREAQQLIEHKCHLIQEFITKLSLKIQDIKRFVGETTKRQWPSVNDTCNEKDRKGKESYRPEGTKI